MKTVTGKILSSTPASISKAAYILSQFVTADTGASQAVSAYLRRATAAFDELVRLHSKPERRKHRKHKSDAFATTAAEEMETSQSAAEVTQGPSGERRKEKENGDFENSVGLESRMVIEVKEEKKKKNGGQFGDDVEGRMEIEIKEDGDMEDNKRKKHKKKKRERDSFGNSDENRDHFGIKEKEKMVDSIGKFEENEGRMVIGEEKEDRKKRKSREVEEESRDEVEEQRSRKEKKRRRGGEQDN